MPPLREVAQLEQRDAVAARGGRLRARRQQQAVRERAPRRAQLVRQHVKAARQVTAFSRALWVRDFSLKALIFIYNLMPRRGALRGAPSSSGSTSKLRARSPALFWAFRALGISRRILKFMWK